MLFPAINEENVILSLNYTDDVKLVDHYFLVEQVVLHFDRRLCWYTFQTNVHEVPLPVLPYCMDAILIILGLYWLKIVLLPVCRFVMCYVSMIVTVPFRLASPLTFASCTNSYRHRKLGEIAIHFLNDKKFDTLFCILVVPTQTVVRFGE